MPNSTPQEQAEWLREFAALFFKSEKIDFITLAKLNTIALALIRLEDIKLILSNMHHHDYEIHTQGKVCKCGICKDITMILNGEKPKVLEVFKPSTEQVSE